jgi:arylsulfatase A-like enzyme
LDWLRKKQAGPERSKPFFLFLHFFDVHYDYVPPQEFDRFYPDYTGTVTGRDFENSDLYHKDMNPDDLKRVIALYDGEILWVDHHIEKLHRGLADAGLLENTITAITSDHGDEFFEHGAKGHRNPNGLFSEVVEIPFILHAPSRVARGEEGRGQFRIIDIMPTLLDLAGVPVPPTAMGESLAPFCLAGEGTPEQERSDLEVVSELTYLTEEVAKATDRVNTKDRILSLRADGYHLTYFLRSERTLLFDLDADPGERINLSKKEPERVQRMLERLKRQDQALIKQGSAVKAKGLGALDPELRKTLEELGYLK